MSISNEALSTEVPTLAAPQAAEPVLFEWDGPGSGRPAGRRTAAQRGGTRPIPTRPIAGAPTPGAALRPPATGLAAALALGLAAAFFGWVSAAPFWLANGVGVTGSATVVRCEDRCTATIGGADGAARTVRLTGLDPADRTPGTAVRARMLDGDDVAYAEPVAGLHLRWILGLLLVLACGVAVGAATGVTRLRREGQRRIATLWALSLGGPAVLALIPFVAALF